MAYEYVGNDKKFKLMNQFKIMCLKMVPCIGIEFINQFADMYKAEINELIDLEWRTDGEFSDEMNAPLSALMGRLKIYTSEQRVAETPLFAKDLTNEKSVV